MPQRPDSVRRTADAVTRAAKHPVARWAGSIASAVVAGVVVVVLTTRSPSTPVPGPSSSAPPTRATQPAAAGVVMTAAFIPDLYSADKDGFAGMLPGGTITPDLGRAPDCETLHSQLAMAGAVDEGGSYVRLVFQNGSHLPAVITQVGARVAHMAGDSLGARVVCTLGAGPLQPLKGFIQLDAVDPVVQAVKVSKNNEFRWKPAGPYFKRNLVSLRPGESFGIDVEVSPGTCVCAWKIVADVLVNGRPGTIVAEDGDQPFRTSGFASSPGTECWSFDFATKHLVTTAPPC